MAPGYRQLVADAAHEIETIDPAAAHGLLGRDDVVFVDVRFVFYCNLGWRSALAARTAARMGLARACHIGGGCDAWTGAGLPMEALERWTPPAGAEQLVSQWSEDGVRSHNSTGSKHVPPIAVVVSAAVVGRRRGRPRAMRGAPGPGGIHHGRTPRGRAPPGAGG